MSIVILCPGQGAQFVGMGQELAGAFPESRALYEKASEILGWDILKLSCEGPAEELNATRQTQPALYAHSCAAIDRLRASGLEWDIAVGHSAGEYAALYALSAWSFEEGLTVIAERARLMWDAAQERGGTMLVCLGLHPDRAAEVCASLDDTVVLANRNAPNQGVISGSVEGTERAKGALKEAGAKRVLPIKVSGAFHSPLMENAREQFEAFLASRPPEFLSAPQGTWISNRTGAPESDPGVIRDSLAAQLTSPVHWLETADWLRQQDGLACLEAGPGNVLAGLLKNNGVDAPCRRAGTPEEIESCLAEVRS